MDEMKMDELPQMPKPTKAEAKAEAKTVKPPEIVTSIDTRNTVALTLSIPIPEWTGVAAARRIDVLLSREQAFKLRSLASVLEERGDVLENGKAVVRQSDAIKWLLEHLEYSQ